MTTRDGGVGWQRAVGRWGGNARWGGGVATRGGVVWGGNVQWQDGDATCSEEEGM